MSNIALVRLTTTKKHKKYQNLVLPINIASTIALVKYTSLNIQL